jgi:ankyrin repeat protein
MGVDETDPNTVPADDAIYFQMDELQELILWLVNEKGADVNARNWRGSTPLHNARSLDVLDALLNRGADPTSLDSTSSDSYGFTPLSACALISEQSPSSLPRNISC